MAFRQSPLILTALLVIPAIGAGFLVAQYPLDKVAWGMAALVVFITVFIRAETGLYLLIFSMLLSPEFGGGAPQGGAFEESRPLVVRMDDVLLVIIGLSWLAKNAVFKELGLFLKTPLNRPVFYYITASALATAIGVLTGGVRPLAGFFFVLKYFEYFIVFFMVVNHVHRTGQFRTLVICGFVTCLIVSIYGIFQIPSGDRVSAPFEGEISEPNTFGGYLVFVGALAAGLWLHLRDRNSRRWLLGLLIVMVPPFLYTESRTSYAAAVGVVFAFTLMARRRALATTLLVLGLAVSPVLLPGVAKNRLLYTVNQPKEEGQLAVGTLRLDTSTSARLLSWKEGFEGWLRHPLLGYGVTGFAFMDAQIPRTLTESGIVGLAAFGYLLWSLWRLALDRYRSATADWAKGLAAGFLAGYVGLLVHSLGANTFIIVRIMEPFWLVAAMIVVLPSLKTASAVRDSRPSTAPLGPPNLRRSAALAKSSAHTRR